MPRLSKKKETIKFKLKLNSWLQYDPNNDQFCIVSQPSKLRKRQPDLDYCNPQLDILRKLHVKIQDADGKDTLISGSGRITIRELCGNDSALILLLLGKTGNLTTGLVRSVVSPFPGITSADPAATDPATTYHHAAIAPPPEKKKKLFPKRRPNLVVPPPAVFVRHEDTESTQSITPPLPKKPRPKKSKPKNRKKKILRQATSASDDDAVESSLLNPVVKMVKGDTFIMPTFAGLVFTGPRRYADDDEADFPFLHRPIREPVTSSDDEGDY